MSTVLEGNLKTTSTDASTVAEVCLEPEATLERDVSIVADVSTVMESNLKTTSEDASIGAEVTSVTETAQ